MSGTSQFVGFKCACGRRTVYVRETMMAMWARPGETIHGVRQRLRCRECGAAGPDGPYPLADAFERTLWQTSDRSIAATWPTE